jgi:hypothetical protein
MLGEPRVEAQFAGQKRLFDRNAQHTLVRLRTILRRNIHGQYHRREIHLGEYIGQTPLLPSHFVAEDEHEHHRTAIGLYRDGDNNLDTVQSPVIDQAFRASGENPQIGFNIEDTTARRDFVADGGRRTESYDLRGGEVDGPVHVDAPHDPSSRANLARFVDQTLDAAERNGAKATWLDLVDHGGGDGGGLQSDTHNAIMSSTDMAGAIADGIAMHAKEHPEDAGRTIDGVVANQCLMSTLGFAEG